MNNIDARERFTLRIPSALMLELKQTSANTGVSVNALILQILWDWLKRQPKD